MLVICYGDEIGHTGVTTTADDRTINMLKNKGGYQCLQLALMVKLHMSIL